MVLLRRALIIGGLVLILGGIGLFGFILFIYPNSDPPFAIVPHSQSSAEGPTPEVNIAQEGYCQVGIRFGVSSEYSYSISGRTHYELSCRASVRNVANDQTVFQFDGLIGDKSVSAVRDLDQLKAAGDGVEHRLKAFPVRAGDRLISTVDVFHEQAAPDNAIGKTNVGSARDVKWFLLTGDHDPDFQLDFRADGPMYGIQVAGIGVVLIFLGIWTGRFVKTQSA